MAVEAVINSKLVSLLCSAFGQIFKLIMNTYVQAVHSPLPAWSTFGYVKTTCEVFFSHLCRLRIPTYEWMFFALSTFSKSLFQVVKLTKFAMTFLVMPNMFEPCFYIYIYIYICIMIWRYKLSSIQKDINLKLISSAWGPSCIWLCRKQHYLEREVRRENVQIQVRIRQPAKWPRHNCRCFHGNTTGR